MKLNDFSLVALISLSIANGAISQTAPAGKDAGKETPAERGETLPPETRLEAIRIGMMLRSYAEENGGKLPKKLDDLAPAYISDKALLAKFQLKTPGAEVAKLGPEVVVLTDSRDAKNKIIADQIQRSKQVEK